MFVRLLAAGALAAMPFALAGCPKKVETQTVTRTVTKIKRVPPPPPPRRTKPYPPDGVYQVGGAMFVVKPGYEQNMQHLCSGYYLDSDNRNVHNDVDSIHALGSDIVLVCNATVTVYATRPLLHTPVKTHHRP